MLTRLLIAKDMVSDELIEDMLWKMEFQVADQCGDVLVDVKDLVFTPGHALILYQVGGEIELQLREDQNIWDD